MTRGRYYSTVMPIWAILYVIGVVAFHNRTFDIVGALVFALLAVIGTAVIRSEPGAGRDRARKRNRGR